MKPKLKNLIVFFAVTGAFVLAMRLWAQDTPLDEITRIINKLSIADLRQLNTAVQKRMAALQPDKEVRVDAGSTSGGLLNALLEALSAALKRDAASARFRVTWNFYHGSWGTESTAVYDRQRGTFKHYLVGSVAEQGVKEDYLYTGVTDEIIHQIAKARKDASSGTRFSTYSRRF